MPAMTAPQAPLPPPTGTNKTSRSGTASRISRTYVATPEIRAGSLAAWTKDFDAREAPGALDEDERAELDRLRREVKDLRQDRDILRLLDRELAKVVVREIDGIPLEVEKGVDQEKGERGVFGGQRALSL